MQITLLMKGDFECRGGLSKAIRTFQTQRASSARE